MKKYQVIVVGGGPAGFCAAIAAARMGANVLLVEQYGVLGGAMTVGGVPFPMSFSNGERQVVKGIGWELMERLLRDGWAKGRGQPIRRVDVDPVMTACEMDCMVREAGVELLLDSKLCKVTARNGVVQSVQVAGPEGLLKVTGNFWIDCTGDGQLSALAGAAFEMGDPETGETQPGSLGFWMDGYSMEDLDEESLKQSFRKAREAGELQPGDYYGETLWSMRDLFRFHGLNRNHVETGTVTARSRTAAAVEGRERIYRIMNWVKRSVRPASCVYGSAICPDVWVRESRRIIGRDYVTEADYRSCRKYEDGICCCYYPIDVHKNPGNGEADFHCEKLSSENVASIPLGALIVRDFHNLLVAGRCISGDRMAQSAYRVQAPCMAMGEAAGTAAAIQTRKKQNMDTVDAREVRRALKENGAIFL